MSPVFNYKTKTNHFIRTFASLCKWTQQPRSGDEQKGKKKKEKCKKIEKEKIFRKLPNAYH